MAVRRFWGTRLITNLVDDTKIQSLVFVTYQHTCSPPLDLMIHGSRLTRHPFVKTTSPQDSKPPVSLSQFKAPTPILASHKTRPSTPVSNVLLSATCLPALVSLSRPKGTQHRLLCAFCYTASSCLYQWETCCNENHPPDLPRRRTNVYLPQHYPDFRLSPDLWMTSGVNPVVVTLTSAACSLWSSASWSLPTTTSRWSPG